MKRPALRWVMLWPLVATLSVGALALGIFVERSVQGDLIEAVDDELVRALNAVGGRALGSDGRPPPIPEGAREGNGQVDQSEADNEIEAGDQSDADDEVDTVLAPIQLMVDDGGAVIQSTGGDELVFDEDQLTALAGTVGVRTVDGDPRYRVSTVAGPDDSTVLVALSLEQVDESLASLRRNLVLGGLVLVIVQAGVVWLIATAVARPVTRMSDAAHRIAAGEFESDVGSPQGPRETAALATDLAQMLDRLRHTITVQEQAAAKANQSRRDMERFMADASHELRTPLTALTGYSDLYQQGMLDDDGLKRAMGRIGSESERLTRLVSELLELTRDENVQDEVDLGAVVSAVAHDLRAANPERKIFLELGSGGPVSVTGNPYRLHQAVLNLASNACHHTPEATSIELVVATVGSAGGQEAVAIVSVIDHGPGIDPASAEDIFLPFARGDESRSRRSHDGAGLGLALVRQIAEQHDGSVDVGTTPGGGATFRLSIPWSVGPG